MNISLEADLLDQDFGKFTSKEPGTKYTNEDEQGQDRTRI